MMSAQRGLRLVEDRLAAMGIDLPPAPVPVGNYRRGIVRGGVGLLSGQFPLRGGKPLYTGLAGRDLSLDDGRAAARVAALNVLAQLRELLGSFSPLEGLLRVDGFIASADGFVEQPAVLDGASDLFVEALGERGAHARTAVGVSSLPLNMPVELAVTFAVRTSRPLS